MKRMITSAGLLVVGVAGLQAANTAGLSPMETSKPWSVSAALRGFYDDNVTTLPSDDPGKTKSWGLEVTPSISYNAFPLEQTFIGVSYQYDYKHYFEDVFSHGDDQSHQFKLKLDHKFSERYRLTFTDSFAYSSEPEIIDQNISTPVRTKADGVRNFLNLKFNAQVTELIGAEAGYQNNYYNYFDSGAGSRRAVLNRLEHLIHVDGRYTVEETLVALAGYQFGFTDYIGDQPLYVGTLDPKSDYRNNLSHFFYAGLEGTVMPDLTYGLKLGAQYSDFDNADETSWTPYADASGTYTYLPGSYIRLGVKNQRAATDVIGVPGNTTLDQELTLVYLNLVHRISPQLTGTVLLQYQNSRFNQGVDKDESENFITVGALLNYAFNPNWSAEIGYTYDNLSSDVISMHREYDRNRVVFGVRATY